MSDIIFKDPEVSRRHVQFIRTDNSYLIEDLGSTNGTFVDGERLSGQQIRLNEGQEVALGGAITLIFGVQDDINLAGIRTLEADLPDSDLLSDSRTADHHDPLASYELDEEDEYEEQEASPHIDQLQSIPSLSKKPEFARVRPPGDNKRVKASSPPAAKALSFTNQQIIYLVLGTVLATIVACGALLLIFYFVNQ